MTVSGSWHALPEAFRHCAAAKANSVLLETAKADGAQDKSLLFVHPFHELVVWDEAELNGILSEIDRYLGEGAFVAGYFNYECGEPLVGLPPRPADGAQSRVPLAWLGVFEKVIRFDHATGFVQGELPGLPTRCSAHEDAVVCTEGLEISLQAYRSALGRIDEHLRAGNTYQVNFTDRVTGHTNAEPLAFYETLLHQQPVPFAAFLNRPDGPILSFSPELFFRTSEGRVVVRPMKGTWRRGRDLAEDREAECFLRGDEKNRSEHVMIVDLLRNDLGRICQYGSVEVEKLFDVETYNTVLQMTSTCSGHLRGDVSPSQVFANLFPSGSITGAPKRRTMQIIQELETKRRGVYTGAIGYFAPEGESCFNVAIRTVELREGNISMGVGGGITADSKPDEEYEECCLKASFLTSKRPAFALIETMRCEGGIALLADHMERLAGSAKYFGIRYDAEELLHKLSDVVTSCGGTVSRVRVELNERGESLITAEPLESLPWQGRLLLAEERVDASEVFLRHKTTNRGLYERTLAEARQLGFDEVVFLNEKGCVTEGAISNLFLQAGAVWSTPSLDSGVLPGVQRSHLLAALHGAQSCEVSLEDLESADCVNVCSALRGVRPVRSIARRDGSLVWCVPSDSSRS